MAHRWLLLTPMMMLACSESGVKVYNSDPVAEITSHGDASEVLEGYVETFRGLVSDVNHGTTDLTVTWFMDGEVLCEGAAPDIDGMSLCDGLILSSTSEVSIEVQDPALAAASDHVSLTVIPTESPEAEIVSPDGEDVYYSDQLVVFEGLAADAEDLSTDLSVVWESSIDGVLEVEASPNDDGEFAGAGNLSEGEHFLTLTVTDQSGKTGSDNVTLEVGPPNSAPTCQITAPDSGSSGEQGETVVFEATVGDVDVPVDWLEVSWESDKDGGLGYSTPDSSGNVAFLTSDLTAESHVITLRVTDELGESCTDFIVYSVGTPPSIAIDEPASGDVVNEEEVVTFRGTVGDGEDPPSSLTLSWISSLDGEFSNQGSDSTGALYLNKSDFSIGSHTITVTVTDTDGLYTQASLDLRINAIPTAPVVSLGPDPADTEDDLVATITTASTDLDGDPIVYSYDWYRDGVLSSASTTATLSFSDTTRDQVWTVEVTPNDGTVDGPSASDSITIQNSIPVISNVAISPDPATASDTLICSWTFSDVDGDADASELEWTINGSHAGSAATLVGAFVTDDVVECTVVASDGTEFGNTDSATVTIVNSPPVLDEVTLTPDPAYIEDTLSCTPGVTTDADGTMSFTHSYSWWVNGTSVGESGTTLDSDSFGRGDDVVCTVTPNDGVDDGDSVDSNTVTIGNHAPVVESITLSPDPVYTDDLITADVTTSDEEGDSVSLVYQWYVDGSYVGSATSLDGLLAFDRGQEVYVTVFPFDGTDFGSSLTSDAIIVSNTPPEAPEILVREMNEACSSIAFDGTDDVVELGPLGLDTEWTFEAWLRWDTRQTSTLFWNECFAIGSHYTWSEFYLLHDYECDGDLDFYVDTSIDSTGLADADWHHLAVTFNGQFEVYVDGNSVGTAVPGYDSHRSGPYTGGLGAQLGHWYSDATVNMVRISDTVRYTAAFSPDLYMATDADTELFWIFEDDGATVIEDLSGNGHDGSVLDASWDGDCPLGAPIDGLWCTIETESMDVDGDAVSYDFSWEVDESAYTGALTVYETGDAVPSMDFGAGIETWTCTVSPNDGTDDGTSASISIDVEEPIYYWADLGSDSVDMIYGSCTAVSTTSATCDISSLGELVYINESGDSSVLEMKQMAETHMGVTGGRGTNASLSGDDTVLTWEGATSCVGDYLQTDTVKVYECVEE